MNTNSIFTENQDLTLDHVNEGGHYRIFYFYPNSTHQNFELLQIEIDAGHSYTSLGHAEKSMEYIMVLEGELTLNVGVQTQVLGPDDAADFIASAKHTYQSTGSKTLRAIIINYYED